MDNGGNESILDTYLYETNALLEQLDSIALAAEQADTLSENDVNEVFRIMHTIKGASAMMEFDSLASVAHRIEDMFFIIRDQGMQVVKEKDRPALFDLMFQAIDYFRGEVGKVENAQPLSNDIDTFLEKINRLIAKIKGEGGDDEAEVSSGTAEAEPNAKEAEPAEAEPPAETAGYPYSLRVFFDEGAGMENLRAFMLVTELRGICAEGDFTYSPAEVETDTSTSETIVSQGFLLAFRKTSDRDLAIQTVSASGSVRGYQTSNAEEPEPQPEPAGEQKSAPAASQPAKQPAKEASSAKAAASNPTVAAEPAAGQQHNKETLISVNLSKLDQLSAIVGEIVINEAMVIASPDLKGLKLDNFSKSARQLRKLTDELQDVSMSLRMVPVSSTFQKMNRIVRDMSKKLNRPCKLTLVGEHTEVDKTIVDCIGDPLMHIIRNSMDHGIEETEEERIAAGKDPVGEIILSASHTDGEIFIQVKDDGRGVNCDAVLNKAINNGLASPDTEYSQKEILNFLLMPGFSTNVEVTEFSGRGVGMDVVKKNVEEVGGTVSISSELGKGMTTTLKIPLTMAIMDGMEVSVGDSIFTIPINNIRQSFKFKNEDVIHDASRGEMVRIVDKFYPIVRIKDIYGLEAGQDDISEGVVMWVESGDRSYCLFVDELMGEQQVVVKPLPAYVNSFDLKQRGITGCAIMGDGSICMILDVFNLYSSAM